MSECNGRYEESGMETYQSIPGKIYSHTHWPVRQYFSSRTRLIGQSLKEWVWVAALLVIQAKIHYSQSVCLRLMHTSASEVQLHRITRIAHPPTIMVWESVYQIKSIPWDESSGCWEWSVFWNRRLHSTLLESSKKQCSTSPLGSNQSAM